jgi:hypothetical protein
LILDEPTAGLDVEAERRVVEGLMRLMQDCLGGAMARELNVMPDDSIEPILAAIGAAAKSLSESPRGHANSLATVA